jgi:hypothetical protein
MYEHVHGSMPDEQVNPLDLQRLPITVAQLTLAGWRYLRLFPYAQHTIAGLVRELRADTDGLLVETDDLVCRAETFTFMPHEWLQPGQARLMPVLEMHCDNVKDCRDSGWPDMYPFLAPERAKLEAVLKEVEILD